MSKLNELLAELCPDGVQIYLISNVCDIVRGRVISKDYIRENEGNYPVYSSQTENNGELGRISTYDFEGEYLTWTTDGANAGTVFYRQGKFSITNVCGLLKIQSKNILAKYLYYILTVEGPKYVRNGMGNPKLMSNVMASIKIPIPPLPVQHEIVRILDNFTELAAELTTRRKQYEYYRSLLLSFDNISRWITLGELGKVSMCKRIMKNETTADGDVPFYKIGTFGGFANAYISKETFEKYKSLYSYPKKGDILISAAGTIGRAVVFDGKPAYFQDSNIVWIDNDESLVLNRFLYYYYQLQPWQVSKGGTIARLYNDNISKTKVPVLALEEQSRIVSILDRFDALCNDLISGLPAEIAARQKQYEYYRDKLLTFKEKTR